MAKSKSKVRSHVYPVRLNDEEQRLIVPVADGQGLETATWLRMVALAVVRGELVPSGATSK